MDTFPSTPGPQAGARSMPPLPPLPPVRLRPAGDGPAVPSMANHVVLDASANTAYLNFGFVEPQALAQAMAAAAEGGAAGELQGVLVARMALPIDALALLHLQSGAFLQSLQHQVGDMLATLARNAHADRPAVPPAP